MKDAYEGMSSADLIRQAREELASQDLVTQARAMLDIAKPSADIERHITTTTAAEIERQIETMAQPATPDSVADILRQARGASAPATRTAEAEEDDEESRSFQLPADIIRPRRRRETSPADGRMIDPDDRLPTTTSGEPTPGRRRARSLVFIATAVLIGVSFLGSFFEDQGAEDTDISEPAVVDPGVDEAALVPLDAIEPGTCIQQPARATFSTVEAVPCNEAHDFEVIGTVLLAGGDYPGEDAIYDEAIGSCVPVFETYVGTSYDTSIWWLNAFTPTADAWAAGDLSATCMVFQYGNDNEILRVTTSARGDGR